jgi:signal peptidase I
VQRSQAVKRPSLFKDVAEVAVLALIIFLAVRAAVQNFRVEGESMEPNFHNNELILVNKLEYLWQSPQRGDVIVFRAVPAGQPDRDYIKRIIGVPGDAVSIHNAGVYVNGKRLPESYLDTAHRPTYAMSSRVVPKGDYFVLGDNRNHSYDSSKWPTPWLPRDDIIGKAWVAYWPPSDVALFFLPTLASL